MPSFQPPDVVRHGEQVKEERPRGADVGREVQGRHGEDDVCANLLPPSRQEEEALQVDDQNVRQLPRLDRRLGRPSFLAFRAEPAVVLAEHLLLCKRVQTSFQCDLFFGFRRGFRGLHRHGIFVQPLRGPRGPVDDEYHSALVEDVADSRFRPSAQIGRVLQRRGVRQSRRPDAHRQRRAAPRFRRLVVALVFGRVRIIFVAGRGAKRPAALRH
mmetsp:Transcript_20303/g.68829  ORF Transcript_20303/g.68829 Transcript_20303/m.68829 type:complete len:214 (+) Transcript_20303:434-1075(+)